MARAFLLAATMVVMCTAQVCDKAADIVFVMDVSGSIGTTNYNTQRSAVASIASGFTMSPTGIDFAWVQFGAETLSPMIIIPLDAVHTTTSFVNAVNAIPYANSGATATYLGITTATNHILTVGRTTFAASGDILIVFTDGQSADQTRTIAAANTARANGITVMAVGVGSSVNTAEINGIAGNDPSLVANVDSFATLGTQAFKDRISQIICDTPVRQTTLAPISNVPIPCTTGTNYLPVDYASTLSSALPVTLTATNSGSGVSQLRLCYTYSATIPAWSNPTTFASTKVVCKLGSATSVSLTAFPPSPVTGLRLFAVVYPIPLASSTCSASVSLTAATCKISTATAIGGALTAAGDLASTQTCLNCANGMSFISGYCVPDTACATGYFSTELSAAYLGSCASCITTCTAVTPSTTATPTRTRTSTSTRTQTPSSSETATSSSSVPPSLSASTTATATGTPTVTPPNTPSSTALPTMTPSITRSGTGTGTRSMAPSLSTTSTSSSTMAPSSSALPSTSVSSSAAATKSPSGTRSQSGTGTGTLTGTATASLSITATVSISFSGSGTRTESPTSTASQSAGASPSSTPLESPSSSVPPTRSPTASKSSTRTISKSATISTTETSTAEPSVTASSTETASQSATETASPTSTRTSSPSNTATASASASTSPVKVGLNAAVGGEGGSAAALNSGATSEAGGVNGTALLGGALDGAAATTDAGAGAAGAGGDNTVIIAAAAAGGALLLLAACCWWFLCCWLPRKRRREREARAKLNRKSFVVTAGKVGKGKQTNTGLLVLGNGSADTDASKSRAGASDSRTSSAAFLSGVNPALLMMATYKNGGPASPSSPSTRAPRMTMALASMKKPLPTPTKRRQSRVSMVNRAPPPVDDDCTGLADDNDDDAAGDGASTTDSAPAHDESAYGEGAGEATGIEDDDNNDGNEEAPAEDAPEDDEPTPDDDADDDYADDEEDINAAAGRKTGGKTATKGGWLSNKDKKSTVSSVAPASEPKKLVIQKGALYAEQVKVQTVTLRRVEKIKGDKALTELRSNTSRFVRPSAVATPLGGFSTSRPSSTQLNTYSFSAAVARERIRVPSELLKGDTNNNDDDDEE